MIGESPTCVAFLALYSVLPLFQYVLELKFLWTTTCKVWRISNWILKKVRERNSKLKFKKNGKREDLMIVGIGDASFKTEEKSIGGVFLFIINTDD